MQHRAQCRGTEQKGYIDQWVALPWTGSADPGWPRSQPVAPGRAGGQNRNVIRALPFPAHHSAENLSAPFVFFFLLMLGLVLLILALVFFILAAVGIPSRVNLVAVGLACWVGAQLAGRM
jgi:hypothetical protein